MSWKNHLVTMFMGSWLILGIFLDGFAHNHGIVESFFTPWHAVLYSGFLASAVWIFWITYRNKIKLPSRSWAKAIPLGYGLGVVGIFIFLIGGICDMLWHIVFGIETFTRLAVHCASHVDHVVLPDVRVGIQFKYIHARGAGRAGARFR